MRSVRKGRTNSSVDFYFVRCVNCCCRQATGVRVGEKSVGHRNIPLPPSIFYFLFDRDANAVFSAGSGPTQLGTCGGAVRQQLSCSWCIIDHGSRKTHRKCKVKDVPSNPFVGDNLERKREGERCWQRCSRPAQNRQRLLCSKNSHCVRKALTRYRSEAVATPPARKGRCLILVKIFDAMGPMSDE